MKTLLFNVLIPVFTISLIAAGLSRQVSHDEPQGSHALIAPIPVSEQAATGPTAHNPMLDDHFGNPDHFIQYIIRIPPVHA